MASNYIAPGNRFTIAAHADVTSGQAHLAGGLFGIYLSDAKSGELVAFATEGVYEIPKKAATAFTFGERVFWLTNQADKTGVGAVQVGTCFKVAASADEVIEVRLGVQTQAV